MSDSNLSLRRPLSWEEASGIEIVPMILYRGGVAVNGFHSTRALPFYTWWWLLEGHLRVEAAGSTLHLKPGRWIFIPAGMKRTQQFTRESRIISINFSACWASGLPILILPEPLTGGEEAGLRPLAEEVCTHSGGGIRSGRIPLHKHRTTIGEMLNLRASLACFVNALIHHASLHGGRLNEAIVGDQRLEGVLWSLREKLQAGPLPYEEWERQTGLGRSQIDRLARNAVGMSLHAYRDRLLAAEACRRLTAQSLVKQVAEDLGFVDTAHFCRWMRRHTGRSPAGFRAGHF